MTEETDPTKNKALKTDVLSFDDPDIAAKFYNMFFGFYDGLNDDQKAALAKAAGEHRGQDQLDEQTKLVYTAGMVIILQEHRRPNTFLHPDYKDAIARRLNVSAKQLEEWEQDIIEEFNQPTPKDETPFLFPQLEPETEPEPDKGELFIQGALVKVAMQQVRGSSKIDRYASVMPNTGDETLPVGMGKAVYDVQWNVAPIAGKMQRITPFDQEVEAAISNFIDKCFSGPPTPREGATEQEKAYCYAATLEQIYCMMNGTKPGTYISPQALEVLDKSINKLRKADVKITQRKGDEEINEIDGNIIDGIRLKQIQIHTGHIKRGYGFSRPGLLFLFEKQTNHLLAVTTEQLNISAGYWKRGELEAGQGAVSAEKPENAKGWSQVKISITPLSITIRRYLTMEIFRIRNAGTNDPKGNKITYDSLIKYEADPVLVEYTPDGLPRTKDGNPKERILKQGQTPAEKKSIENARSHRRKLTLDILGHFQATGLITGFQETTEGRKKTGVIIEVPKTDTALLELKKKAELKRYQTGKERGHGKK